MRHLLATAAVVAALYSPGPLTAQDTQDLQQAIEDALDATEGGAPPADLDDLDYAAPDIDYFTDDELDDLLAPVALYPDALLAQVLVASTFPLQIVYADRLLEDSETMSDADFTAAIDERDWDPSVLVLLTGFPEVIERLADDLEDTERLGVAMAQQDYEVLDSIQRLRLQAEETGWLADNEAQVVEREGDRIVIQPADPEIVYVPQYDEQRAFISAPTAAPVYQRPGIGNVLSNPLVAGGIGFGSALLVNELFRDDDNDNDDDDDDGWDDYWRADRRAIDWDDRQVYPRAYGWNADRERRREVAWSRERDRYWDRQNRRWRAEAEQDRREARRERGEARAWEIRRDPQTGERRVALRDWRDVRAGIDRREAVEARRENRAERRDERQDRATAERRREAQREAEARDRERRRETDNAERREERREEAARDERQTERARAERREENREETAADRERRQARQAERERDERRRERQQAEQGQGERQQAEREQAQRERQRAEREQAQRERQRTEEAQRERQRAQAADREREQARQAERQREQAQRERQQAERQQAERQAERQQAERRQAERQQAERQQARQAAQREERQAEPNREQRRQRGRDCPEGRAGRECRQGG